MTDFERAFRTIGAVSDETRAKTLEIMYACQERMGRAPGVLWGLAQGPEHSTGRAVDFMISHHGWGNDSELGDFICQYILNNAARFGLKWVIWKQHLTYASGTGYAMEDRGSTTNNHYDHVHVFFEDNGYEGEEMALSDNDVSRIAEAVWRYRLRRPDGHWADACDHLLDVTQRMLTVPYDSARELINWMIKRNDGHTATFWAHMADMATRIVGIYDMVKREADKSKE